MFTTSGHNLLTEIDTTDIINLMAAVPKYAKAGSAWYCSSEAEALVFDAIKIAGGGNTTAQLAALQVPTFLGYPILSVVDMPNNPATDYTGEMMIDFGNLRMAAALGNRRGTRVQLSTEQYWEEDCIGVKGTERFDIVVHDLGDSDTKKSPLCVLVGN